MKRLVTILSSFALAISFFGATPALAAGEGTIKLSPVSGTQTPNSTFQVQVRYGAATQAVIGVNAVVTYDPTLLSTTVGAVSVNTTDLNLAPPVLVDATTGRIEVGAAKAGTTGTVQSDALLATITFTAKAAGTATVGITQSGSAVNIYDGGTGTAQNILGSVTGASYTIGTGGGGGGDTTAPTISATTVSSITQTGAKITWTTNESASGKVDYGTTTSYGLTASETASATSHSITLSGLTAGTKYYYRITSADGSNNSASSQALSFTTTEASSTGGSSNNNNGGSNSGNNGGTYGSGSNGGTSGSTSDTPLIAPVTGAGQWIAIGVAILAGIIAVVTYAIYAGRRDKKRQVAGTNGNPSSHLWQ